MRLSFVVMFVLLFLHEISAGETSSKQIYAPMKPHDHTGTALDIMTKRDVMRFDYGAQIYGKHCAGCHGAERHDGAAPSLSEGTLKRFETISDLYLYIKQGCSGNGTPTFKSVGDVALIFAARHINRPLKQTH